MKNIRAKVLSRILQLTVLCKMIEWRKVEEEKIKIKKNSTLHCEIFPSNFDFVFIFRPFAIQSFFIAK